MLSTDWEIVFCVRVVRAKLWARSVLWGLLLLLLLLLLEISQMPFVDSRVPATRV